MAEVFSMENFYRGDIHGITIPAHSVERYIGKKQKLDFALRSSVSRCLITPFFLSFARALCGSGGSVLFLFFKDEVCAAGGEAFAEGHGALHGRLPLCLAAEQGPDPEQLRDRVRRQPRPAAAR